MPKPIEPLALELAKADSESEVIEILKTYKYWDDPSAWADYGDIDNNFSTIGNQQSSADAALVEKLINSVDAVLTRECLRNGIAPDSSDAPQSLPTALNQFFSIPDGKLSALEPLGRNKLAENIYLVASGAKGKPSLSVIDKGEGQAPSRFQATLLSLGKSNKLKIPFVQGKFNMGGTGALQFCGGHHNLQLIISRRDPSIPKKFESSPDRDEWGVTVVRRDDPKGGVRSSTFRYLSPNKHILSFKADSLPLLPGKYPSPCASPLKWGTFIKLYEYQIKEKTNILFDLYNRLSLLLPNVALPIRMCERRSGYSGHTFETTLSGLSVRLDEDRNENLEPGFPSSGDISVNGQKIKVSIFAFKKEKGESKREKYARSEGVLFSISGQAHGFLPKSFFERKAVGKSYLSDSILVTLDCTNLSGRSREDLFMNSRDRLRDGVEIRTRIERELEDLLKDHVGLRSLQERRRQNDISSTLADNRPVTEILQKVINKSPVLSKLLITGDKINNPFKLVDSGPEKSYEGKKYPTLFKLIGPNSKEKPKTVPVNALTFRAQFETDAVNDYFDRDVDPGEYTIITEKYEIDARMNLWNGTASLNLHLPEDCKEGDSLHLAIGVIDSSRIDPFTENLWIRVGAPINDIGGKDGQRRPPSGKDGTGNKKQSSLGLPEIKEVRRTEEIWSSHFRYDDDAIDIKFIDETGYDFYINMSNKYLLTELKSDKSADVKLSEAQFKYGMTLLALGVLNYFEKRPEGIITIGDEEYSSIKIASLFCNSISPFLLPVISQLGDMQID